MRFDLNATVYLSPEQQNLSGNFTRTHIHLCLTRWQRVQTTSLAAHNIMFWGEKLSKSLLLRRQSFLKHNLYSCSAAHQVNLYGHLSTLPIHDPHFKRIYGGRKEKDLWSYTQRLALILKLFWFRTNVLVLLSVCEVINTFRAFEMTKCNKLLCNSIIVPQSVDLLFQNSRCFPLRQLDISLVSEPDFSNRLMVLIDI